MILGLLLNSSIDYFLASHIISSPMLFFLAPLLIIFLYSSDFVLGFLN